LNISNSRRDNRNITDVNSRRRTSSDRDARNSTVDIPTTVLSSAGTPFEKKWSEWRKIGEKRQKESKNLHF
jgi:hypothetical protein